MKIDKILSRKVQIFSSILRRRRLTHVSIRCRIPSNGMRIVARHTYTHTHEYSLNSRLAKAIYKNPRVKTAIRHRHGQVHRANLNLMHIVAVSVSWHRDISANVCLLISVKSRIGGLKSSEIESFRPVGGMLLNRSHEDEYIHVFFNAYSHA